MSKGKTKVNDLLAAIKRQPTPPAPVPDETEAQKPLLSKLEQEAPERRSAPKRQPAEKKPKSRMGKPSQFWMHAEDRQLVRELSAWLAGQGMRPTDSMVIRAVLRLAKTGNGLLEAYWQAAQLDGRIKRD
ncbi:MAG: hypothetical protein WB524_11685 [Acidobacteriaceae bacterium]|jgi:hypothetical protein